MVWCLVITILLSVAGCKKNHCYHCYHYSGIFFAIKGTDTVSVGVILARAPLQDSMNHYVSLGYSIDTFANGYFPDPPNGTPTCGTPDFYSSSVPDSCSIIM